jgi:hypothetical protein
MGCPYATRPCSFLKYTLKFFGAHHGHEEIDEERKGDEPDDQVFHSGFLLELEFSAEDGVEASHDEDARRDGAVDEISHDTPPLGRVQRT